MAFTRRAPAPTTTITRSGRVADTASIIQDRIGRPATGCSTLGMSERMRTPSPAAIIITTWLMALSGSDYLKMRPWLGG